VRCVGIGARFSSPANHFQRADLMAAIMTNIGVANGAIVFVVTFANGEFQE